MGGGKEGGEGKTAGRRLGRRSKKDWRENWGVMWRGGVTKREITRVGGWLEGGGPVVTGARKSACRKGETGKKKKRVEDDMGAGCGRECRLGKGRSRGSVGDEKRKREQVRGVGATEGRERRRGRGGWRGGSGGEYRESEDVRVRNFGKTGGGVEWELETADKEGGRQEIEMKKAWGEKKGDMGGGRKWRI